VAAGVVSMAGWRGPTGCWRGLIGGLGWLCRTVVLFGDGSPDRLFSYHSVGIRLLGQWLIGVAEDGRGA
jgi:hypothetical protein